MRLKSEQIDFPQRDVDRLKVDFRFSGSHGKHSKDSPVVGSRASELQLIYNHKEIFAEYQKVVYYQQKVYVIPVHLKDRADEISKEIYAQYIKKYSACGVTIDNSVDWCDVDSTKVTLTEFGDDENIWGRYATVAKPNHSSHINKQMYRPAYICALHELMHVEEMPPGVTGSEFALFNSVEEVLTVTRTLILMDEVYKRTLNLPMDIEVDYGVSFNLFGKSIKQGELANFYRKLETKYPSLAEALVSNESLIFLGRQPIDTPFSQSEFTKIIADKAGINFTGSIAHLIYSYYGLNNPEKIAHIVYSALSNETIAIDDLNALLENGISTSKKEQFLLCVGARVFGKNVFSCLIDMLSDHQIQKITSVNSRSTLLYDFIELVGEPDAFFSLMFRMSEKDIMRYLKVENIQLILLIYLPLQTPNTLKALLNKIDDYTLQWLLTDNLYSDYLITVIAFYMLLLFDWRDNSALTIRLFKIAGLSLSIKLLNAWLMGKDLSANLIKHVMPYVAASKLFSQEKEVLLNQKIADFESGAVSILTSCGRHYDNDWWDYSCLWREGLISIQAYRMLNHRFPHSVSSVIAGDLFRAKLLYTGSRSIYDRGKFDSDSRLDLLRLNRAFNTFYKFFSLSGMYRKIFSKMKPPHAFYMSVNLAEVSNNMKICNIATDDIITEANTGLNTNYIVFLQDTMECRLKAIDLQNAYHAKTGEKLTMVFYNRLMEQFYLYSHYQIADDIKYRESGTPYNSIASQEQGVIDAKKLSEQTTLATVLPATISLHQYGLFKLKNIRRGDFFQDLDARTISVPTIMTPF